MEQQQLSELEASQIAVLIWSDGDMFIKVTDRGGRFHGPEILSVELSPFETWMLYSLEKQLYEAGRL